MVLALAGCAVPATAQDFVTVTRLLSDEEFHQAVACGAAPGGPCRQPERRWPSDLACELMVSIRHTGDGYPGWLYNTVSAALDAAIREINDVDAGISLLRVPDGSNAEIMLYLPVTRTGEIIRGTGEAPPDGLRIDSPFFLLSDDGGGWLSASVVVLPRDIFDFRVHSVVLEELTQSLGLPYDVAGQPYQFASIFDENGDALNELSRQDKAALRTHYPSVDPCAVADLTGNEPDQDHRS